MTQTCVSTLGPAPGTRPISLGAASAMLKELSEPWPSGGKVKTAIGRAAKLVLVPLGARLVPLNYWRAFDIWYEKAKCLREFEFDAIADALQAKREREARNELQELRTRIDILESRLRSGDADFHGPTLSVLGQSVRGRR